MSADLHFLGGIAAPFTEAYDWAISVSQEWNARVRMVANGHTYDGVPMFDVYEEPTP